MAARPGGTNKVIFALVVVLALAVIVVSYLTRPGASDKAVDDSRPDVPESPTTVASPTQSPVPAAEASTTSSALAGQTSFPELGTQPGSAASGSSQSLPEHTVTIRLRAAGPVLGSVAYVIPTSPDHETGNTFVQGPTWTLTTTVYGNPKYAAVFGQGDYRGRAATCEITVDGRLTERRSTKGPYGAMWCVG